VQGGLVAVLALIAGYIDSYTLLSYEVYASFMSGNTTQTGLRAGQGRLAEAGHYLLPVPLFVIGIFIGTFLLQGGLRRPLRRLWGLVASLLAGAAMARFGAWILLPPVLILLVLAVCDRDTRLAQQRRDQPALRSDRPSAVADPAGK
jgi:uncharacterized membrane protein YoaK (UPF0700 family)